jgi:TetR/AcrR family transcriptional repressor of nem operon
MTNQNKKDRLVDSASILFHRTSLAATSLADIAKHAEIPIGNVYYYFKTKEDLALAAVQRHKEQFAQAYRALNDTFDDPRVRLIEITRFFDAIKEDYTKYGCPMSKIINDTDIATDNIGKAAASVLNDFASWAQSQFRQLGHGDDARYFAHSLVAGIQGAVVMAKAAGSSQVMSHEIERLTVWLEAVPNKKIRIGKVKVDS